MNNTELELKVGTQFYYEGIKLEVVEKEKGSTGCHGCFFCGNPPGEPINTCARFCSMLECNSEDRKDRKNVFYRKWRNDFNAGEFVRDMRNKEALDKFFFNAEVSERERIVRSNIFKTLSQIYVKELKTWKAAKFPIERLERFLNNIMASAIVDTLNNFEAIEEKDQEEMDFLKAYTDLARMVRAKNIKVGSYFSFLYI